MTSGRIFVYDGLEVDFDRRRVRRDGERVLLTPMEFRLLTCLIENPGKVMTHEHLLEQVWGDKDKSRGHLKLYVFYLRRKLERDPLDPEYIITDRGVGYHFNDEQDLPMGTNELIEKEEEMSGELLDATGDVG